MFWARKSELRILVKLYLFRMMNKQMTGVLGILLIFLVGSASFDIVVSDTATTTTQFPLNAQTQLKFDSMKINPNPLGNAALWIWHSGNGTEATF